MKKALLKSLKSFAMCIPFMVGAGIWSGYGASVAYQKKAQEGMDALRASPYEQVREIQEEEYNHLLEINGEAPDAILSEAVIKEKTEKALSENEQYAKLEAEESKYSKYGIGFAVGGGACMGLGFGIVSSAVRKEREYEL